MSPAPKGAALGRRLRTEWQHLATFHRSRRRWQMPVAAGLATGLPVLVGTYFGRLDYGLVSSLGGLAFLYLPDTPMYHRMARLMACAFGIAACYALGIMSHAVAVATVPLLTVIAVLVTMTCRYYRVGPPASLFFVMVAAIGAYSPVPFLELPLMVGLVFLGGLLAAVIAFGYSLIILRLQAPTPVQPLPQPTFEHVVLDSVLIGALVGLSLLLAVALQLERPYWVPVSCMAVIQGTTLRAVWNRNLQRVVGTAAGMLVAWGLLSLPLGPWAVAPILMLLSFTVEWLVVRHYGLATVFITPLTILLAEAARLDPQVSHAALIQSRFMDTMLGCAVGLLGGVVMHQPRLRAAVGQSLRALMPARMKGKRDHRDIR
ncbi:hypothetical protein RHOFW510R12_08085 [Rhodanobacter sp. FW510-R12]|uniref:FUSC family protein n=1 Tax=unclassified Rhodanobacter TaxID=2621553 RepID=UPI0007A9FEB1|nr:MULTISPECIES: FUSC family protein [unclassified Rhodanobacter]KZC16140.1 hypothetical protein RHOFW104R8_01310 [Rhodanobacter sp. FW104-R8]KZC26417.1 hypothetical protein RhoFW510T8_02445 [Rhodanobacter sp. FW510-T8]KZC30250.1 hypothetical protein RhoFW510R10_02810 [Rhodanobacter sp. FW510-R10]